MSRLNAIQHGQAGAGDLLAPGEDENRVARRSSSFGAELGVDDEVGRVLAYRAALLSIRMEAAAERDLTAVAASVAAAHAEFDQELADDLARRIAALEAGAEPRRAIAALEALPDGVDHLVAAWRELRAAVALGDRTAADRARLWLGSDDSTSATGDLDARIDAEQDRLTRLVAGMVTARRALAQARHESGLLASFDPSPEATLARRYEAAAERGMYRAIRAIADHRRSKFPDLSPDLIHHPAAPGLPAPPPPITPTRAPEPRPPARAAVAPPNPSLGSFRADIQASTQSLSRTLDLLGEPPLIPTPTRKNRPDLAKLLKKRR